MIVSAHFSVITYHYGIWWWFFSTHFCWIWRSFMAGLPHYLISSQDITRLADELFSAWHWQHWQRSRLHGIGYCCFCSSSIRIPTSRLFIEHCHGEWAVCGWFIWFAIFNHYKLCSIAMDCQRLVIAFNVMGCPPCVFLPGTPLPA